VLKFAKLYAEFTVSELVEFEENIKADINSAKKKLAFRLTSICHGQDSAQKALATSNSVFEEGSVDANMLSFEIARDILQEGVTISHLLCISGLADSNSEGKRLVRGNSVSLNGQKISDENFIINIDHLKNDTIKLSSSAKKHLLIKLKQ
jgi:tyrosyl-tRNA synthetase